MANYQEYKIQTFINVNDSPEPPTSAQAGNGSHLINRYNEAIEAIQSDVTQIQGNITQLQEQESPEPPTNNLIFNALLDWENVSVAAPTSMGINQITGLSSVLEEKADDTDITGESIKNILEALEGNSRLNYSALRNTPTIPTQISQLTNDLGFITLAPVQSVAGKTGAVVLTTSDLTEGSNLYYTDARADGRISAQKGQANGLATLGSDSKIPTSQLPAIAITDTFVVSTQAQMLALTAQVGEVAVRTDLSKTFILQSEPASTLSNWQELLTPTSPASPVTSVNAKTGAVVLTTSDLTEGSNLYYTDARADGRISVQKGQANGLATLGSDSKIPISQASVPYVEYVTVSSSRSIAMSDHGKTLLVTSAVTLTLPNNSTITQNIQMNIRSQTASTITFTAGSGATRNPSAGNLTSQDKNVYLQFNTATNIWNLSGALS